MKAIILRSGKELKLPNEVPLKVENGKEKQEKNSEETKENRTGKQADVQDKQVE